MMDEVIDAAAFREAYAMMLQRIADHPEWLPEIEPGIRRALIRPSIRGSDYDEIVKKRPPSSGLPTNPSTHCSTSARRSTQKCSSASTGP